MRFEVEIHDTIRVVSVQPMDAALGRFRVALQPRPDDSGEGAGLVSTAPPAREIEVVVTDLGLSVRFLDDGRVLDAAVTERNGGECFIQLPQVALTARIDGRHRRHESSGSAAAGGPQRITAPMPGRVLRVLVQPGDHVTARQPLVVVEAMKMENELTATRPGRVREIGVTAGAPVEAGRLLVLLDPER